MLDLLPNPLILPVGFAAGILIAAPVGPVNVLCIQRAITRGMLGGVFAGLGAVLGDGLIALLAALGVGAISRVVMQYRFAIQLIGGLVLLAFALRLWRSHPHVEQHLPEPPLTSATVRDYLWDVPNTLLLTITNPGAVLGLIAIFGGVSTFVEVSGPVEALILVTGVMAGSLAWWVFLSTLVSRIRHRIDDARLHSINQYASVLLILFASILLGELALKTLGVRLWG